MKYLTTIIANLDDIAYKSIEFELEKMGRSQVKLSKENNKIKITVEAPDSVALRAALNGITKLFTVYEKVEALK